MNREDKALIVLPCVCLLMAFLALKAVPSTKYDPQEQGWYPTPDSRIKKETSQTIFSASQTRESNSNTSGTQNQPKQDYWTVVERRLPDSSGWQAIFDFLLFAVGCVQIAIYRNLRRDSIIKDRAFVFIRENQWRWLYDEKNVERVTAWKVRPILENSGNTRARITVTYVSYMLLEGDLPTNFDFPDVGDEVPEAKFNIAPHATAVGPECGFSVTQLVAVKKGYYRLFVWGWLEYYDVFEPTKLRRFEFCNEILVDGDPRLKDCVFTMRYLPRHNGEDTDCHRKPGERGEVRQRPVVAIQITSQDYKDFGLTDEEWAKRVAEFFAQPPHDTPPA